MSELISSYFFFWNNYFIEVKKDSRGTVRAEYFDYKKEEWVIDNRIIEGLRNNKGKYRSIPDRTTYLKEFKIYWLALQQSKES